MEAIDFLPPLLITTRMSVALGIKYILYEALNLVSFKDFFPMNTVSRWTIRFQACRSNSSFILLPTTSRMQDSSRQAFQQSISKSALQLEHKFITIVRQYVDWILVSMNHSDRMISW